MSVLIIAEHDNATLKPATLHVVTAAQKIGGDIHILVAGQGVDGAAAAAAVVRCRVRRAGAGQPPTAGQGLRRSSRPRALLPGESC